MARTAVGQEAVGGKCRCRGVSAEPLAPIPVKDGGGSDRGGSPRGGDGWSGSECVLMEERKEFVIPGVGRKKQGVKDHLKFGG